MGVSGTSGGQVYLNSSAATSGNVRFYELSGNGTNYVALRSGTSVAANINIELPVTVGTTGQMLTTTVSGSDSTLGWTTPTAAAAQSDQETASSTTTYVSPGRQQYHPSAAKCWAQCTVAAGVPTMNVSYNMTSITDSGTGLITFTIATDFSSANYAANISIRGVAAGALIAVIDTTTGPTAGALVGLATTVAGTASDPVSWHFTGFGDQA
jgi:hypothetical protein